jgi:hypothetical protein
LLLGTWCSGLRDMKAAYLSRNFHFIMSIHYSIKEVIRFIHSPQTQPELNADWVNYNWCTTGRQLATPTINIFSGHGKFYSVCSVSHAFHVVIYGKMRRYQMVSLHHNGLNGMLTNGMVQIFSLLYPTLTDTFSFRASVKPYKRSPSPTSTPPATPHHSGPKSTSKIRLKQ